MLLADTKQRQRLLQEARTSERLEQLEIEACEEGRQLRLEYLELMESSSVKNQALEDSIHSVRVTTRKISYKNQKTVQIKSSLRLKAQINSSFLIPRLRNPDTTMSNMHTLGVVTTSGTTTASMVQGEPNPATTAETDIAMDIDDDGVTTDEDGELANYNEEGTAAATEETRLKDLGFLRELFAGKGKEYRAFLKSEKAKDLYTSPMTVEMSVEDILLKISIEDLHSVSVVKGLLIMPPSFVQSRH